MDVSWVGRAEAIEIRHTLGLPAGELIRARETLDRVLNWSGLTAVPLPTADPLLAGARGVLDRDAGAIWVRDGLAPAELSYLVAHELGHWWLHPVRDSFQEGEAGAAAAYGTGLSQVEGYSPVECEEIEASAFASELLAPGPAVTAAFMDGLSAEQIAETVETTRELVTRQLVLYLLDGGSSHLEEACPSLPALSGEQKAAATSNARCTLVLAGPGTGKTAALAGRALHLLQSGVLPDSILALTFTRTAAEELRQRLKARAGVLGTRIAVFTAHAFCLNLLRMYGWKLGLPPDPKVVSGIRALSLLEQSLHRLDIEHLACVENPVFPLVEVLQLIQRWKARGMAPERALAEAAADPIRVEAALIYGAYQEALQYQGGVDFADLLSKCVFLLESDGSVRNAVLAAYRHLLVDEVQDLDPMVCRLLKLLHGPGVSLWLVGDPAQAIFAFRGASWPHPRASEELPAADRTYALREGFRCSSGVTSVLREFAKSIGLLDTAKLVEPQAASPGLLEFVEAADDRAQADYIVKSVRRMAEEGMPLDKQAVLCRTNAQVARLAVELARSGLPVEAADSFLRGRTVQNAIERLSALANDAALHPHDPEEAELRAKQSATLVDMMDSWYFGQRGLARDRSLTESDRRSLAQLYWVVRDTVYELERGDVKDPQKQAQIVLADLRRAVSLGEDRIPLRMGPRSDAAVHVMTIHAAKGLQFEAVFVPFLNAGYFPPSSRPRRIADGPEDCSDDIGDMIQQEARVLFVAMSRACRFLTVLQCTKIGGRYCKPSTLAEHARSAIVKAGGRVVEWTSKTETRGVAEAPPQPSHERWHVRELDEYAHCPYRYWLSRSSKGDVPRSAIPYAAYRSALRQALVAARKHAADPAAAKRAALDTWEGVWRSLIGTCATEPLYRRWAERVLTNFVATPEALHGAPERFQVTDNSGVLEVDVDEVRHTQAGVELVLHAFRARPGQPARLYALDIALAGARRRWPEEDLRCGVRYLLTGDLVWHETTGRREKSSLARYVRLMQQIQRGVFSPRPSEWCGSCEFLFRCPRRRDVGDEPDTD